MTAGKRATVKVRWERGGIIGPWMTPTQAAELALSIEQQVIDCGDSCRFVPFTGFDGRDVHIRGREVITIECIPEVPARLTPPVIEDRPAQTHASGGIAVAHVYSAVATGQATPGTQFLRQQAAQHQTNGARR